MSGRTLGAPKKWVRTTPTAESATTSSIARVTKAGRVVEDARPRGDRSGGDRRLERVDRDRHVDLRDKRSDDRNDPRDLLVHRRVLGEAQRLPSHLDDARTLAGEANAMRDRPVDPKVRALVRERIRRRIDDPDQAAAGTVDDPAGVTPHQSARSDAHDRSAIATSDGQPSESVPTSSHWRFRRSSAHPTTSPPARWTRSSRIRGPESSRPSWSNTSGLVGPRRRF